MGWEEATGRDRGWVGRRLLEGIGGGLGGGYWKG